MACAVILRTPLIGMRTSRSPVAVNAGATYVDEPAAVEPSPVGAARLIPAACASTSARLTIPPSPDPATWARSMPRSLASLRTGGLARALPLAATAAERGRAAMGSGAAASAVTASAVTGSAVTGSAAVSYTHLRAHETRHDLVCRL